MNISYADHVRYMQTTFSFDEYYKIIMWLDNGIYYGTDEQVWFNLVTQFKRLPDNKKTKAFIYQILVFAKIVDDGINGREGCPKKADGTCKRWHNLRVRVGDKNITQADINSTCYNLIECVILPSELPDWVNEVPEYKKGMQFYLDDSILKRYSPVDYEPTPAKRPEVTEPQPLTNTTTYYDNDVPF